MNDPLRELAARCGVEPEFVDALGKRRVASREVLRRVLSALGVEAGSPNSIRAELRRLDRESRRAPRTQRATKCFLPRGLRRGLYANLYSVRATRDSGFGDFAALGELIERAGAAGLDYVAINPLHALRPRRVDASPYSPVSRLWKNPLYLDLDRLVADNGAAGDPRIAAAKRTIAGLARARMLDYDAIAAARAPVLAACHQAFLRDHPETRSARSRGFRRFVNEHGDSLERFTRYRAIDAAFTARGRAGFSKWPAELRDPASAAVSRFAASHRVEVEFEKWLQFELDEQWRALGDRARQVGLSVGLHTDLAIGAAPDSADVWGDPEGHVRGFSLGAPPDGYSEKGQVWNLPPMNPIALLGNGGERFVRLLRAVMDGAGATRIDHAIGLVRQYWVPEGAEGTEGVMVNMPSSALFAAIARESRRARCAVVAEDLGTVPESLPPRLREYGLLSTRVVMFGREHAGGYAPPSSYPKLATASWNTHDLPPFSGWWRGKDLPIRRRLGLLTRRGEIAARAARGDERRALMRMLREEGFLGRDARRERATLDALHRALLASPCRFATLSLDDLAGETEPINVPTATIDRYPVWSRRMTRAISRIAIPENPRQR